MTIDPFEILGVPRSASDHEIATAYRSLARQFHPDAHPEATADEKAVYETAMARINQAYGQIKDPADRERWLRNERMGRPGTAGAGARSRSGPGAQGRQPPSPYRPPGPGECVLCGCAPAEVFTFVHQIGMIISSQRGTTEASLCRLCALAVGRSQQNRTLVTGWWGLLAFFTNFAVVFANAGQLRRAHRLGPPQPVANVVGRIPGSMHPGRPVHRRAGLYVAAVIVGFVAFVAIGAARSQPSTAGGGSGGGASAPVPSPTEITDWSPGNCVRGTVTASPVACTSDHDGRITDAVTNLLFCPPGTDTYVQIRATSYCIDMDR